MRFQDKESMDGRLSVKPDLFRHLSIFELNSISASGVGGNAPCDEQYWLCTLTKFFMAGYSFKIFYEPS